MFRDGGRSEAGGGGWVLLKVEGVGGWALSKVEGVGGMGSIESGGGSSEEEVGGSWSNNPHIFDIPQILVGVR